MSRILILIACCLLTACKTYDQHMEPVQREFYGHRPERSVEMIDKYLEGGWFLPGESSHNLLKLEKASVLQADNKYSQAQALFQEVDENLEILDYSNTDAKDIAAFLFATDAPYKGTTVDRMLINAQGMISFLSMQKQPGWLENAGVEARKIGTLRGVPENEQYDNRFANGLAGFVFDLQGNIEKRNEFWGELEKTGTGSNPFRHDPTAPDTGDTGTVLVVVEMGKAPIRREYSISMSVQNQLYQLRMPVLVDRPDSFDTARLLVDGHDRGLLTNSYDVGAHLMQHYEEDRARLLAAAATQLATRAVAAKKIAELTTGAGDEDDGGRLVSFVANLFLTEMQPPDTRGWTFVPQSFHVIRVEVPAGQPHDIKVELRSSGGRIEKVGPENPVEVEAGGLRLVHLISDVYRTWTDEEWARERLEALQARAPSSDEITTWEGYDYAEEVAQEALAETGS